MHKLGDIIKMMLVVTIWAILCVQYSDAVCSFPANIQNKNWTSDNFQDMLFATQTVNFTITVGANSLHYWTCHVSSGTKYVIQSTGLILSASLNIPVYIYYCLDLREQSSDSYLYYLLADGTDNRIQVPSDTVTIAEACSATVDTPEYHVMINSESPTTVMNNCASPLLGNFLYACASASTDNGTLSVCGTKKTFVFNDTECSRAEVLYSSTGVLNCVASIYNSTTTVYYQTLYNTDTAPFYKFICLAVSTTNGLVYMTYNPTVCTASQTSQSGGSSFESLAATTLCPLTDAATPGSSSYVGLIVGLVVGFLAVIIVAALILYFCYFKRDPNAGKPIVENTKPRFEDPDKDDVIIDDIELDRRSTPVTRDDITFEAASPTIIPNGKIQNGHVITSSPTSAHPAGFPNGVANGSVRYDSGFGTSKSMDRPTPRIGLNPSRESMVIFNGDEKVISGNDTRIVPNTNPDAHRFKLNNSMTGGGILSLEGLEGEEQDELGEMSPRHRDLPYPSLPREKSNLMPPIETVDPEKEKEH